jgi:hypothetical protein
LAISANSPRRAATLRAKPRIAHAKRQRVSPTRTFDRPDSFPWSSIELPESKRAGALDAVLLHPAGNPHCYSGNFHATNVHGGRGVRRLSQPRRESALVISALVREAVSRSAGKSRVISGWNLSTAAPPEARSATRKGEKARARSHRSTKTSAQDREVHLELPAGRQHPVCARAALPAYAGRSLGCGGSKPLPLRGVAARPGFERDALGSPCDCQFRFAYMAAVQLHGKKRGPNGSQTRSAPRGEGILVFLLAASVPGAAQTMARILIEGKRGTIQGG